MTTYAIIGDGAAGTTAAFYVRRHDPGGRLIIYSDDPIPAYYRAALTNYLMDELRADQLFAVPPNFYTEFRVDRVLAEVDGIDTKEQRLSLSNGQKPPYDRLLISAGSRPRPPAFSGSDLAGVMTMRTMQDARFIMDQIQAGTLKRAVIAGGGILGLEMVAGLRQRKVGVTYVIRGTVICEKFLDKRASDLVLFRCRQNDVDVRLEEEVEEAQGKDGRLEGIKLKKSGETVKAQLMAAAYGIIPNIEFLEGSGIETRAGIPVDEQMRTNVENVYAAGDVVEVEDPFNEIKRYIGLWEPSRHQGRVAGINMCGGSETWRMPVEYNATRLYDLDLAAVGDSLGKPTDETKIDFPEAGAVIRYRKLVVREDKLAGALLLGTRREKVRERGRLYRKLITLGADIAPVRDMLLDPYFDLAGWVDSLQTEPQAPVGRGTMAMPSARATLAAMVSEIRRPPPEKAPVVGAPSLPRATLSGLMRPVGAEAPGKTARAPGATVAAPAAAAPEAAAAPGMLRLADGRLEEIGDALAIGRRPDNRLVLADDQVSGNHAEIKRQGAAFVIADLGSTNGTFVNESVVAAPRDLHHGDVIRLGRTEVTFVHQVMAPRATTGPAGLPAETLAPVESGGEVLLGRLHLGDRSWDVGAPLHTLGRNPESDIVIEDPAVSQTHCQISRQGNELFLRDLGSRNGSYVNAEPLTVPRLLREGDVIHLGNTDLTFRSLAPAAAAAAAWLPIEPPAAIEAGQPVVEAEPPPVKEPVAPAAPAARAEPKSEPAAPPAAHLVCRAGPVEGAAFSLADPSVLVGRDPAAQIVVEAATVSWNHALIEARGSEWVLSDLGSTNGTAVNGTQLPPKMKVVLAPGDEIRLGDVVFTFETTPAPEAEPRAATVVIGKPATPSVTALGIKKGAGSGGRIPLDALPRVLGREDVGDEYVSGRHLEIAEGAGGLVVRDLGSRNGTWLNGRQLEPDKPEKVEIGDELRLGPETTLEVE